MTLRLTLYRLCLSAMCFLVLFTTIKAQYSEGDLLKEANALFDKGEYAMAMPLYSQLLSLNPTKPEFNYKYGATALYGDADKKEEAIRYLRYASTKYDIDHKCWYFLGRAYHLNYQFADAIRAYNKFKVLAGNKEANALQLDREIEDCQNGQNLLANIKDVKVLDKKQSTQEAFFRLYDLSEIGGRILVTPEELLTSLDKKLNHKSLIHYRGSGTTVYFSSYGKDGKNGLDIYSAEVLPDGKFSNPVLLGPSINTPYDEDFPFLHSDNESFYFSSKGHSSMGGYDVFKSKRIDGSFSTPENLDFAVNTPDDDVLYMVDSTKTIANFASARSSKQGELHVYKVLVNSVPADITFVKGSFINQISATNKLAKITVVDAATNKQIDVQYTDPQSGDYVLSFPRSGRFKFSVEAEKSTRIHTGIVDIPKSSGINAYLQEMELVSSAGVEKLVINNLFDQHYDGDVSALARNLLRQRAALDVNFNIQDEPDESPAPIVEDPGKNIDLAYNAAGFGAGLSNEKVLEASQQRQDDLGVKKQEIADLKHAAEKRYFKALASANTESEEVKTLIAQAQETEDAKKGELMFRAGLAKMEAENAVREASNIQDLISQLGELENKISKDEQDAAVHTASIESALASNDYDKVLTALKTEKTIQENQDKTKNEYDAVRHMQFASLESRKDAQRYLDRASSMRDQSNEIQQTLMNKETLRARSKGKEAKDLDEEIKRLTAEAYEINERVSTAYKQATTVQEQSYNKDQQYDIISDLQEQVRDPEFKIEAAEATADSQLKTLSEVSSEVAQLEVNSELVSQYLKDNPGATDHFNSEKTAMAFRRAYAAGESQSSQSQTSDLAYDDKSETAENNQAVTNQKGQENPRSEQSEVKESEVIENASADEIALFESSSDIQAREKEGGSADSAIKGVDVKEVDSKAIVTDENTAFIPENTDSKKVKASEIENEIKSDESTPEYNPYSEQENLSELKKGTSRHNKEVLDSETDSGGASLAEAKANVDSLNTENQNNEELAQDTVDERSGKRGEKSKKTKDKTELVESNEKESLSLAETEMDPLKDEGLKLASHIETTHSYADQEEMIAAEEAQITMAKDWIAIIDDSIADLEKGVGAEGNENIDEQLKQYQALKRTKNKEIATSEAKIAEWKLTSLKAAEDLAMARTEADLDTLSVSHTARLEMRIADLADEKEYQAVINLVSPNYLEDLAMVELSGKSDPEIATERIALNRELISTLDFYAQKQDVDSRRSIYLLELRRIKGLETRQDRLIQTGEFAYSPRSKEAIEYAEVIASAPDEKVNRSSPTETTEFEGLSPELAADLKLPYARSGLIENYDSQKENIETTYTGEKLLSERIELNEQLYEALSQEIGFYHGAVQTASGSESGSLIVERYNILLAEQKAVEEEIESDQIAISEYSDLAIEKSDETSKTEEPLEVFINSDEKETEDADVTQIDPQVAAQNYVANFDKEYKEGLEAITSKQYDDRRNLEEIASLNADMANKIDSTVNVLVNELDKPGTQINKDALQVQIQNLDAIAADKRQEADRLMAESQLATLPVDLDLERDVESDSLVAQPAEATLAEAEIKKADQKSQPIDVSVMEAEWEEEIEVSALKYKSLNANIAVNAINPLMESLAKEKTQARELATRINTLSNPVERAEALAELKSLNVGIKELQDEIKTEVAVSNAAEIAYFHSSNDELFRTLNTVGAPAETDVDNTALTARQAELANEMSAIESRISQNEITLDERIEAERDLIAELSEFNETLKSEVNRIEPETETIAVLGAEPIKRGRYGEDEFLRSMMSVPENYTPEPGKMYITPVHSYINQSLSDTQKAELAKNDRQVAVDFDFVLKPSREADETLLLSETKIDQRGLILLNENKNQRLYILASLKADSLKRLEKQQAEFARRMDEESIEKFAEIDRLTGMVETETNPALKKNLESRVDRIFSEATINYQKSAMASFQAEKLRNLRREQESEIAGLSAKLSRIEMAESNEILGGEPYTVVPSDFATAELSDEKPKPTAIEKTKPKDIAVSDSPDLIAHTPEIAEVKPPSEIPLASDVITVNENLHSIDEQLLLEAHGNWLNVFEVIADKDDFSDVRESLFVKSDGSVYDEDTRIPINPPMPSGLVFQVQVGAFRNKIPQDLFGDFAPVMGQELPNGITRYRAGIFKAYKGAIAARNEIRERGYSDAFVVAYINGERLTGTEAQQILEQARVDEGMTVAETRVKPDVVARAEASTPTGSSTQQPEPAQGRTDYYNDPEAAEVNLVEATSGLFFTVQVGVYSKPVKLDALFNLIELNSELTSNGYIRYTSGRYTSTETAEIRKAEVIQKGVTDAFITAYYNGSRISAARAQSILEEQGQSVLSTAIGQSDTTSEAVTPDTQKEKVRYVVVLGSYSGDIPQQVANVFLERSDLQIRRVTAPNGVSIYASPEFETWEEADEFLKLSIAAGVDSAVMGKVVDGRISAVGTK